MKTRSIKAINLNSFQQKSIETLTYASTRGQYDQSFIGQQ